MFALAVKNTLANSLIMNVLFCMDMTLSAVNASIGKKSLSETLKGKNAVGGSKSNGSGNTARMSSLILLCVVLYIYYKAGSYGD
jgi:hypothetical protein